MKKFTMILLSILLIAALMATPVFATGDGSAAVTSASGAPGETVYLTLSLSGFEAADSVKVTVTDSKLTLDTANSKWLLEGDLLQNIASDNAIWGAKVPVDMNKPVLTLAFTVPEPVAGQTDFNYNVTCVVVAQNNGDLFDAVTTSGTVTVVNPATGLTLDKSTLALDLSGTKEATLTATVTPANSTDLVTWSSSDTSVATVSGGKVTALKEGTATITATAGSQSKSCTVTVTCGHTSLNETAKNEPTCQATGNNQYYTCNTCGKVLKSDKKTVTTVEQETLSKLAHSGGTATCLEKAVCSMCEQPYGETLSHSLTKHSSVAATCVAPGNVEYWECANAVCDGKYYANKDCTSTLETVETAVDSNNHAGTEVKGAKAATCYQTGHTGNTYCTACKKLVKEGTTIQATGEHVAGTSWSTDKDNHWHICTTKGCGTVVDKKAHTYTWKVDKEATEDATGLKHEECVCGVKRNEGTVIPKLDHKHTGIKHYAAVPATCVKTGTVEYWTCSSTKCAGKYYGDAKCQLELTTIAQAIDADNHASTEVKNAVAATCSESGYTGDTYCADCKVLVKKGTVVPTTGKHTPKEGYLADEDKHWQECADCDAVIDSAKAEHTFAWVIDRKPTESAVGVKHEECTVCHTCRNGNTSINKLTHNPVHVEGKAATCAEEGVIEHFVCNNCGKYYAAENGKAGKQITKEDVVLTADHVYGTEWVTDAESHWHECECGEVSDLAAHETALVGAVEATDDEEGYTGDTVCSVCEAVVTTGETIPCLSAEETTEASTEAPTEEPTAAPTEAPAQDDDASESGSGAVIGIVAAVAVVGVAAYLVIAKKRKRAE